MAGSAEPQAPSDLVGDEASQFEREAAAARLGQRLTHVFTLLTLLLDREPLHLAFSSLGADDARLRGTAREYLDSVLPPGLRTCLAPLLDDRSAARRLPRPRRVVLEDLVKTARSLELDPETRSEG